MKRILRSQVCIHKTKKGFTLTEIIVVLVILAVLAAATIPTMLGFIQKAQKSTVLAECRYCVVAAQAMITDSFAESGTAQAPAGTEIQDAAGVSGTVSGVELNAASAKLFHLTYTRDEIAVTYCGSPATCPLHDETYTFADGSGGSGTGNSTGGDSENNTENGTENGTDNGTGGTPSATSVTLTDSTGATHILQTTGNWTQIKELITTSGWNYVPGTIVTDDTGTYICSYWSQYVRKIGDNSVTMASLSAENPTYFRRLTSSTVIWCEGDLVDGKKWDHSPKAGELCYLNGKYYIAPTNVNVWTLPPGGWAEVAQ